MGKLDLNYDAIFEDLPRIMGLDLKRHGRFWHGKCYIDGTPHAYRYDKMVCTRDASGGITIMEQGGDSMQLYKWMQLYGGCSSSKETYERLKSMSDGIVISKPKPEIPTRYVEQSILDEAMERIGRLKDPLFRWLCTKFPEERVEEAYRKLAITPCRVPQGTGTQFWYIDEEQRILHDKIIITSRTATVIITTGAAVSSAPLKVTLSDATSASTSEPTETRMWWNRRRRLC